MSFLHKKYKDKRPFGDVKESRTLRAEKQKELRKIRRDKVVGAYRKGLLSTSQNLEVEAPNPVEIRTKRLLQWKAERERRKRMEQMKKRPPFVVGIVHHKIYSPVTKDEDNPKVKKMQNQNKNLVKAPSPPKRVTRATMKRLMLKAQQTKKASKEQSKKKEEQSFAPANYEFKVPAGLNQELLFGRVDPRSMTPTVISKFVLPPSRLTRASTNSSTTKFIMEEIASATIDKKDDTNSSEENSNDTFTLNVSSSEDTDDINEAITSDKDSNEKEQEKNDESLNNSTTEPNKQFNNSITKDDTVLDNNAKSAPSSSNNNTPTPANSNSFSEPVFYSPYIVSSRGKSNARKEQQLKRGFSLGSIRSDDIPTKDNVMKNLNISVEEEERTAQYFQFLLNKEIDRLNELCIQWEQVKTESNVTEDAQYQINQAVGQTNLLISKKFERFRSLVSDCETGKGQMLVTCRDLQGFWDMMYMEVKNCDSRFEKLEQLRSRNWVEEQPPTVFKPIAKKSTMRKKTVPAKSSSVRAFLANRKKGKQETGIKDVVEEPVIINNKVSVDEHELNKNSPNVKCRPRRSVSIHLNDKKYTPIKSDRTSLLQKVQLSESKRLSNSLAVIKISNLGKTPEVCSTESYFNSTQTPGKSILKQRKDSNDIESHTKITHKVNFDDSIVLNEIPVDEETQTKMSLAAALAKIDNISFDYPEDNISLHAERKLIFNDDSFEDTEDVFNVKDSTGKVKVEVIPPTPSEGMQLSNNSNTLPRRKLRRQNAFTENDESSDKSEPLDITIPLPSKESGDVENSDKQKLKKQISINIGEETDKSDENVRVLRSRSIISVNTPTPRRRSSRKLSMNVTKSEHKENKTPAENRRKSFLRLDNKNDKINAEIDLHDSMHNMNLSEKSHNRRSRRKSVKFSEEDCSGCIVNKPVHPVTPHVRRSRVGSNKKEKEYISGN